MYYFSSIITIKLIKGENLPLVTKDETKAFVSVQIISNKADHKTGNKENTVNTNYQRTYKFSLSSSDFTSHTIRFEISRFDRFSKKYDVGHVTVCLAELGVDISRETFFTRNISPSKDTQVYMDNIRDIKVASSHTGRVVRFSMSYCSEYLHLCTSTIEQEWAINFATLTEWLY